MLSRFGTVKFACLALSISVSTAFSQTTDPKANELFVEAVTLYRDAQTFAEAEQLEAFTEVRALFDLILREHPDSRPANVIGQGDSPGGVILANLPASKPVGWNDGKRGVARDLLAKYGNDVDAIENVAQAALYAHFAWAAYGADEPKQFLEQRGWKLVDAYRGDRSLVGDVTANLFEGPTEQYVLAFRGSVTGGDWVTNIGGTLSPTPLLNGQVVDALRLADEVAQKFPDVVFVGHSLGGRLAQASSLKTGNLAYAFNSAPVGYNEIREMGFQELIQGKMRRFRSPQDQLSGVFTPSDTVVANIEKVDANALFNLVNLKDYTHAMNVLAQAMESVSVAWEAGWITAYLNEQEASEEELSASGKWGPSIVPSNGVELGYRPCGDRTDVRRCLEEKGLTKDAIDFSFAVAGDLVGEVFAIDFQEAGEIDVAHVEFNGASPHRWPVLLNGSVGEIALETTNNLAAAFTDPTSKKMLQQFPQATSRSAQIRSHRLLQDGTQRFVLVETIIDGCRACPILGSAVTFLEFGPATGGTLRRTPIGLSLEDPSNSVDLSNSVLRQRPESLQTMLNILGYNAGEMDGYPGPQTRNALMIFQAEYCLAATGQPDQGTAAAIIDANGFDVPCMGQNPPDGVSAITPLLAGMYVDDPKLCDLESIPSGTSGTGHLSQLIVRGNAITWGHEGQCTTRRTDIRQNGITLFRGTCAEGNESGEASWRFDVLSNSSFIDLDMPTAVGSVPPRTYTKCPDDSVLRRTWSSWFGEETAASTVDASQLGQTSSSEPVRGTSERKAILDAVRPIAERHFGPPVEFVVGTMRVLDGQAYVELSAQRPGGGEIDLTATPAAERGEVDFGVGNGNIVSGFLIEQAGNWEPRDIVVQATEAWWVGDCAGLKELMPETCGGIDNANLPAQSAKGETSTTPVAPPSCAAEWVITSNGCRACVERPEGWLRYMQKTANPSTRWSGACKDGLIDGQGVLTWYSGEDEGWRTILNARYPAVDGVPAFELRPGDVTVRYATNLSDGNVGYDKVCVAISDYVHDVSPLLVIVNADIPIANPEVHKLVMEKAERIALADCEKERKRVSIRKEVSRFQVYSINLALSNHPRVKPFHDTGRPIPGGDLYRILPGCGFRPRISGISECFQENPATDEIRQQVTSTNQSRAQAIRQAERLRAEQAAQAEKAQKQAKVAAIQKEVEERWASHMDDMFTGQYVIQNVGDLLQYNKARAISLLSQGITLELETANMSFQDGTVIISHEHDPTDVLKPVRDAARAEMGTWEQWFDTTASAGRDYSGPSINVVCRLDVSALEQLDGKKTAQFFATMQSLSGRSAVFDCKLKR